MPSALHLREHGVSYLVVAAGAVVMRFPFVWMLSTSLKVDRDLFITPPQLIPNPFAPENYRTVLDAFPVGRFLINSVAVAVASTALQVVTSAMTGHAFPRLPLSAPDAPFPLY